MNKIKTLNLLQIVTKQSQEDRNEYRNIKKRMVKK